MSCLLNISTMPTAVGSFTSAPVRYIASDTVITAAKAGEMDAVLAAAQATFRKDRQTKPRKTARGA